MNPAVIDTLQRVSKPALLAAAIAIVTAGVKLLDTDLPAGIALLLVGVALIVVYAYLLEKQTEKAVLKTVLKRLEKK